MARPDPQDRVVRELPVTPAQYAILVNVAGQPGLTAAELARRLQVSPQNVAVLVAGLLDRGPLLRRPYLTDAGQDLLRSADGRVDRPEAELRNLHSPAGADALRAELERVARWDVSEQ